LKKALTYSIIDRYSLSEGIRKIEDPMVAEIETDLFINSNYVKTIYYAPVNVDELIIGCLAFLKIIKSIKDIRDMIIEEEKISVITGMHLISSAPRRVNKDIEVPAANIIKLMQEHLKVSELHRATGGVHIMSLSDGERLLVSREDIGRFNAVDKLFGYCLKNDMDCSDKVFFSSGRISSEMVEKIKVMGVNIMVSRATVTTLAQKNANDAGITLIGFTRGERFNIYSHPERIK